AEAVIFVVGQPSTAGVALVVDVLREFQGPKREITALVAIQVQRPLPLSNGTRCLIGQLHRDRALVAGDVWRELREHLLGGRRVGNAVDDGRTKLIVVGSVGRNTWRQRDVDDRKHRGSVAGQAEFLRIFRRQIEKEVVAGQLQGTVYKARRRHTV